MAEPSLDYGAAVGTSQEESVSSLPWVGSEEWLDTILVDESLGWNNQQGNGLLGAHFGLTDADFVPSCDFLLASGIEHPGAPRLSLSRPLSDHHFTVPNALTLTPLQHQVLYHYQTVFSTYRSTKDPKWGTHKMLLNYASYDPMIMHFILAVSSNDYSIRTSDEDVYRGAQEHYDIASDLWIKKMKSDDRSDDLALMISYFFLYLYMTKRRGANRGGLQNLSKSVVEFVKKNRLDKRCLTAARSPFPSRIPSESALLTSRQRSLLARLVMWIFDEDVRCGFQGSGGYLAEYLSENDSRTKDIYDASRGVLENHWGSDYPDSQVFDDNENSVILEFLFAMTPLQQDINDLSSGTLIDTDDICRRIERKFISLEQDYSSVFRIAATKTMPRTRVLVNADYDVVLFNSLRIYYFRSTIVDQAIESPPEICKALKTLLCIVQITFAYSGTELYERLQWPLFLAGIETDDMIYREWILSKLTSYRVLAALRSTLDAQRLTGKRSTMTEIRDVLHKGDESNLALGMTVVFDATTLLSG